MQGVGLVGRRGDPIRVRWAARGRRSGMRDGNG